MTNIPIRTGKLVRKNATLQRPDSGFGKKTAEGANASYVDTYALQLKRNVTSKQERRVSRSAPPLDKTHSERVNAGGAAKLDTLVTCMSLCGGSGKFVSGGASRKKLPLLAKSSVGYR
ncbi:hypothetical protein ABVT39_010592 [Epinephelus coioides]